MRTAPVSDIGTNIASPHILSHQNSSLRFITMYDNISPLKECQIPFHTLYPSQVSSISPSTEENMQSNSFVGPPETKQLHDDTAAPVDTKKSINPSHEHNKKSRRPGNFLLALIKGLCIWIPYYLYKRWNTPRCNNMPRTDYGSVEDLMEILRIVEDIAKDYGRPRSMRACAVNENTVRLSIFIFLL